MPPLKAAPPPVGSLFVCAAQKIIPQSHENNNINKIITAIAVMMHFSNYIINLRLVKLRITVLPASFML